MNDSNPGRLAQLKRKLLLLRLKNEAVPQRREPVAFSVARANRREPLVLSWQQRQLWFLEQMGESNAAYHIAGAVRFDGPLDRAVLQRTLDAIIARHEVLHSTFMMHEDVPVQRINAASPFPVRFVDTDEVLRVGIERLAFDEAHAPFDLERGPLIRGRLLRLAGDEHLLLVTMHHIISDGWSINILLRELVKLYAAFQRGAPDPLPALAIQYADYASWQQREQDGRVARQLDYWCKQLSGAPTLIELPTDHPRPVVQNHASGDEPFEFDAQLTAQLNALARRYDATLFMTLLAGWAILLARFSGQKEVMIGTPVANRPQQELEALIGFFVNTLALRTDLSGNPSVGEFVERIKATALAGFAHQEVPFEQVVEALKPGRSLSHSPLIQVMFALQSLPAQELKVVPGLSMRLQDAARVGAQFDLTLAVQEIGGALKGRLVYASSLFDAATIKRWLKCLETILRGMVEDEDRAIESIPLLSSDERKRVLYEFNATRWTYPHNRLIHELIEAQALEHPDAEAVAVVSPLSLWERGGGEGDEAEPGQHGNLNEPSPQPSPRGRGSVQTLTYDELNRRANRLAHALRAQGVEIGQRVALCVERGPELLVGFLGILKAGGVYVPLNPVYPQERLAYILADVQPKVVLTQARLAVLLPELDVPVLLLDADWQEIALNSPTNPDPKQLGLVPSSLAYVIYTSGSTGQPKGVMIEHRGVCNLLTMQTATLGIHVGSRVLQFASPSFDASIWEFVLALGHGASLHLAAPEELLPGAPLLATLQAGAITHVTLPPGALAALNPAELPALETVVVAGEVCPEKLAAQWSSGRRFINAYGPTEITVCATTHQCAAGEVGRPPIGRPVANTQIYILDAHQKLLPIGAVGEIYVGGVGVARGYLNRPKLTIERFVPNPFSKKARDRLYRTGDLGRWREDGSIDYLGRNDFQVKLRGFRIEPGEIEACLLSHPSVRDAVVVVREDQPGEQRLVAYLIMVDDSPVEALRRLLRASLPGYMIPAAFVTLAAMPLTPNGKVDRRALPEPDEGAVSHPHFDPPQDEIETALAAIWADILKLERVGRHDNFFDLGGHSLLTVQVIERLRQVGLKVDVRSLFSTPVLSDLAQEITCADPRAGFAVPPNRIPAGCEAITPAMLPLVDLSAQELDAIVRTVPGGAANVQDIYPLAPLQEGILFHHLLNEQRDAYILPVLFAFETRARLDDFLGALRQVISRHDVLRSAILWEALPRPVQVVYRQAGLPVEEIDCAGNDPEAVLRARMTPDKLHMDLRRAPLVQVQTAADPASPKCYALLQVHHLTLDHVSLEIVVAEAFASLAANTAQPLPPPVAYRGFVAQALARAQAQTSTRDAETFFRNKLGDFDEPSLPFGLTDTHGGSDFSQTRETVAPELSSRIRQSARQLGVSAATLFHAAWALVIARTSGRDDVLFGSVLSGRLQGSAGADRAVGMFINTLPLRLKLVGQGAQAFVLETQRELMALLAYEQTPLAQAQRVSGVAGASPLFTALLNYRHSAQGAGIGGEVASGIQVVALHEGVNYPFTLSIDDLGEDFSLSVQIDARIAAPRVTAYLRTALAALVDALETAPERSVFELDILPPAERDELLLGFNATAHKASGEERLIHEIFAEHARRTPDAIALQAENNPLTYGELDRHANRVALTLRALGVQAGQPVALCMERGQALIVGILAILKAGGAYLPLDPNTPTGRLAYILSDAAPSLILTTSPLRARLPETPARTLEVDSDGLLPPGSDGLLPLPLGEGRGEGSTGDPAPDTLAPPHPLSQRERGVDDKPLASIIYTSGSTGQPKGVMIEHRGIVNLLVDNPAIEFRPGDHIAHCSNPAFDASTFEIWGALLNGASLLILSQADVMEPETFISLLKKHKVSIALLPVGLFNQYVEPLAKIASKLRYLLIGGEALEPGAIRQLLTHKPPRHLLNAYGPTEITVYATLYPIKSVAEDARSIPIGRPIANTQIYILDAHGQPVPVGVTGEIYIGGAGVARGYWNRPELTAERFVPDLFPSPAPSGHPLPQAGEGNVGAVARMYKTGDLGRWQADGNIEYVGRNDFQLKLRGFRIEPGEIEARLAALPSVREAVVLLRDDAGGKRLVAYLTPSDNSDATRKALTPENLRRSLSAVLPDYMVPGAFVTLAALPLTPSGKLDRRALPAPGDDDLVRQAYEPPQGETEAALAAIWIEVLKLKKAGRYDNFFELGGHSLLAIQVVTRVRQQFNTELSLRDVFEHPRLLDLARLLQQTGTQALPAIEPVSHNQNIPLSWSQQQLWFLEQLGEGGAAYHISGALRLKGQFDPELLEAALDAIVARHESLRTTFVNIDGTPGQNVRIPSPFALRIVDLEFAEEADAEIKRHIAEEVGTPFDLLTGPLIRGCLLRLAADDQLLLITMHHIVSDGWSMSILVREAGVLYEAFQRGEYNPLPPLTIQYADYAWWQQHAPEEQLAEHLDYWREQLRGAPALIELPTDRLRPAVQSHAGSSVPLQINAELTAALNTLAHNHGATLFMVLFAGWAILLSRLSTQDDIVIGTPVANRPRHELEALIGFFVNTLALRVDLSGNPDISEFIDRIKALTMAGFVHQEAPFEKVVETLRPERSLSYSPLFQVMLAFQSEPEDRLELPGLTIGMQALERTHAQFDITLALREDGDGTLRGGLEYARDLFDEATVTRWLGTLQTILRGMVADETQTIGALPILSPAERDELLYGFNAAATGEAEAEREPRLIHELFEAQARRAPKAVALVCEGETLTYGELDRRANQLAHTLHGQTDQPIAICVERSLEMIVGLLGILKAGGAYVPLDPAYPRKRLAHMLKDAAPKVVLTQTRLLSRLRTSAGQNVIELDAYWPIIAQQPETPPTELASPVVSGSHGGRPLRNPHRLAYIIYTSGSTGQPKGVMVEHANVVRLFTSTAAWFNFGAKDVWTLFHSFAFDFSVWEIWGALLHGGRLVLVPQHIARSPDAFYELLCREKVTVLNQTPTAFHQLIEAQKISRRAHTLRQVIFGGEALEFQSLAPWIARNGDSHPELVNMYGITETTVHVTYRRLRQADLLSGQASVIGKPIPDLRVYILDASGQPVPIGVAGEIHVGGAGVARGYLNRPELTAERFVPDLFPSPAPSGHPLPQAGEGNVGAVARMYKTGDLGRWRADGNIEYLGRNDFQVKLRGFRIELGEIETRLLKFPAIQEAAVLLREDQPGNKRLVAYFTSKKPPRPDVLRTHLRLTLPDYMTPTAFVLLDTMPLTPNGKLDRRALPAPFDAVVARQAYEPPQTKVELTLATIWAEVLKLEKVSRRDDFFALGGHSLLVVKVIERLRQAGFTVDVRNIFNAPVLCDLALDLARNADDRFIVPPNLIPDGSPAITPAMLPLVKLSQKEIDAIVQTVPTGAPNVQDVYPLAPLQEGILFHHLLSKQGDGYDYVFSILFELGSRAQLDAFLIALRQVIARHDILRSAVLWEELSHPVQVVYRHAELRVDEIKLEEGENPAEKLAEHSGVDLHLAPLMRVRIAAAPGPGPTRWFARLAVHHLILDNFSLNLVASEALTCLAGQADTLPQPVAFRGFVAHAQANASANDGEVFFRARLSDVTEPTLPFGLADVLGESRVEEVRSKITGELALRVRRNARQLGVSVAALFHSVWALVIARTSGRDDVVFGSVLSGRLQGTEGADRVVGMFINTLPLRLKLAGLGVGVFVRTTQRELVDLMAREQTPLALALRVSGVAGSTPLFSALINFRHSDARSEKAERAQGKAHGVRIIGAQERTNYPFALAVDDMSEAFVLTVQVDSRVAATWVNTYVRTALEEMLNALENTPDRPILDLPILSASVRDELLRSFNATAISWPDSLIHELFEDEAIRNPDALAVISPLSPWERGGGEGDVARPGHHGNLNEPSPQPSPRGRGSFQTLTYGELNRRANQLAHALREQGIGPDQPVAICVERSLEMIIGLLGILKAGGAYVPLDPDYPAERLAWMLTDAAPRVLLTQTRLRTDHKLPHALHIIELDADWPTIAQQPDFDLQREEVHLKPENLAYIIYTSGSTGQPKGVMLEHRQVTNYIHSIREAYELKRDDRYLLFASISFDGAVDGVFGALCSGATLVLRDDEALNGLEGFARTCNTHGVTLAGLSTAYWHRMMADLAAGQGRWPDKLRLTVVGGEAILKSAWATWQQKVGAAVRLVNNYGPTETTVAASRHMTDGSETAATELTIGRPISNTRIYILDATREPVPAGVAGEIYIGGAGVARGYLNRPEATAGSFAPDPFNRADANARMYKTGDLGRWRADGHIEYLGRNDEQVKLRGFRVEPGEIEARLTEHPGIREAVVLLRADPPPQRLVAYITPTDASQKPDAGELRDSLRRVLPNHMVPTAFVLLASLPLTPNGKVDRRALPAPADAAIPRAYIAPQGATEEKLAALWAEVLEVERAGRDDDFFAVGGYSLLAVKMLARIREQFSTEIDLRDLLEYPTLREMAARLSPEQPQTASPASGRMEENLVVMQGTGTRHPLFLVHVPSGNVLPYVSLVRLLPETLPVYGLQVSEGEDDGSLSVENLAARHIEAIRRVQPHGPYRLAGWSAGGLVAYEMASQLLAQGEPVDFVGLLDTYCPGTPAAEALQTGSVDIDTAFLLAAVQVLNPGLGDSVVAELGEIEDFGQALARCKALNLLPQELSLSEAENRLKLYRAIIHAAQEYRPEPLQTAVHLFSANGDPTTGSDSSHGWRPLLGKHLKVRLISGTHIKLMEVPHVRLLAVRMAVVLKAADRFTGVRDAAS
jgi:amino acid adenylation domain-containing protein